MSDDELPGTPGAVFAQPSTEPEPLVVLELDRRAALLDGIATETCIMCGTARSDRTGIVHVSGRFSHVALRASLCAHCAARAAEARQKVSQLNTVVKTIYFAQLTALAATMITGGGGFLFSALSVLLLGTVSGSVLMKRGLLRDAPRLLGIQATSIKMRAPASWQRVLLDERPQALANAPRKPLAPPAGQ